MASDDIEQAREAFRQQRWSLAFSILSDPSVSGSLGFADLERLAQAAHMLGRPHDRQRAGERAYNAALAAGDLHKAAWAAFCAGFGHFAYRDYAQVGGW